MSASMSLRRFVILCLPLLLLGYFAWSVRRSDSVRLALPINTVEEPDQKSIEGVWPSGAGWPASTALAIRYGKQRHIADHLTTVYRVAGVGTVASVVDGVADVGYAFLPPLLNALKNKDSDLVVLGIVLRSYRMARIVAKSENANDWFTKRIAVKPGTITDSMLAAQLRAIGKLDDLKNGRLQLVPIDAPENLFFSLLNGQVESAVLPGTYGDFIAYEQSKVAAPKLVDISMPNIHLGNAVLVAKRGTYRRLRTHMLELLDVFRQYGEYVEQNPQVAMAEMQRFEAAGASDTVGSAISFPWQPTDFLLITDKSQIREALRAEASLRVEAGLLPPLDNLEEVLSELDDITSAMKRRR